MDPLPELEIGSTISEIAQQCRDALQICLRIPNLMSEEWAENRLAEFKLWAAGTGAFAGEKASLDSRLAIEFDTKSLVMNILTLLLRCIRECQDAALLARSPDINDADGDDNADSDKEDSSELSSTLSPDQDEPVPRSFSPWSDMSSDEEESDDESSPTAPEFSTASHLSSTKDEVEQVLNHLSRLAMAIRKSGAGWRAQKADRRFRPDDHAELGSHLVLLILARGCQSGRESYEIDDTALTPVQQRLITANLRRRNRFIYAQSHARKLAFDAPKSEPTTFGLPTVDDMPVFVPNDSGSVQTSSRVPAAEQVPFPVEVSTPQPLVVAAAWTATSASHVATQILHVPQGTQTPSQVAKTNITSTAAKVVYPKPPRAKDGLRYFSCPCCCQILPEMFRQDTLWKKHLMEDVCPYTCIIEECSKPDTLYMTRSAWMKHVKEDHQKCWECSPCSAPGKAPRIFGSIDAFVEHLGTHHQDTISEDQHSTLVVDAARPVPAGISKCPLCDETNIADADPLFDHIAEHLHSFALRALPWPSDDSEDPEKRDRDDYFREGGYFDDGDEDQSNQYNVFSDSDRDSEGLASLPSNATNDESPRRRRQPYPGDSDVSRSAGSDALSNDSVEPDRPKMPFGDIESASASDDSEISEIIMERPGVDRASESADDSEDSIPDDNEEVLHMELQYRVQNAANVFADLYDKHSRSMPSHLKGPWWAATSSLQLLQLELRRLHGDPLDVENQKTLRSIIKLSRDAKGLLTPALQNDGTGKITVCRRDVEDLLRIVTQYLESSRSVPYLRPRPDPPEPITMPHTSHSQEFYDADTAKIVVTWARRPEIFNVGTGEMTDWRESRSVHAPFTMRREFVPSNPGRTWGEFGEMDDSLLTTLESYKEVAYYVPSAYRNLYHRPVLRAVVPVEDEVREQFMELYGLGIIDMGFEPRRISSPLPRVKVSLSDMERSRGGFLEVRSDGRGLRLPAETRPEAPRTVSDRLRKLFRRGDKQSRKSDGSIVAHMDGVAAEPGRSSGRDEDDMLRRRRIANWETEVDDEEGRRESIATRNPAEWEDW